MSRRINDNVVIGKNVKIEDDVVIGKNVKIEDDVYIDYGTIIKDNVHIKKGTFIGARCILGEYLYDFFKDKKNKEHLLEIGENSIIRSNTIIYGDTIIGDDFQSGHNVVIRENVVIGKNTRIGTNGDIQDNVIIGNYVNIHSNVFISAKNIIKNYVWIFPRVLFTNDPTPPSNEMIGSIIEEYAAIGAGTVIIPGSKVKKNVFIGAGTVVRGELEEGYVYVGNPSKKLKKTEEILNPITGEKHYPWQENFDRGMPWQGLEFKVWEERN